jgi:hypothetical protein
MDRGLAWIIFWTETHIQVPSWLRLTVTTRKARRGEGLAVPSQREAAAEPEKANPIYRHPIYGLNE